ncbi:MULTISPECIES: shikimate kinase AroL [Enterobacterales]|uniref:shikimate kinase AroL n=1 Tax=Enterobacterales TaxID=91347 RepID=UPI002EDA7D30
MTTEPIFLIGARGCGKTTVGQKLAQACQFDFLDTDQILQQREGRSIADIVAKEGWPAFRSRETQTLQSVTVPQSVIATGGGIILAPVNREFLRKNGIVIYLKAPVAVLAGRLEAFPEESQRPTLTGKPISEEVREILAQRDALYRETAHHVVDAACDPDDVVAQILSAINAPSAACIQANSATAG